MRGVPAVECTACGFAWRSQAMAEGLRLLGSCPRCGGELAFHAEAAPTAPEPKVPDVSPARAMGRAIRR
jgi:hypothetical protein